MTGRADIHVAMKMCFTGQIFINGQCINSYIALNVAAKNLYMYIV